MWNYNYYTYILTNPQKTTLYIGVTNDLAVRLKQHYDNRGNSSTFTGKYHCYLLVYYEHHANIGHAIDREKEIKKWSRTKKNNLIETTNPNWSVLNDEFNFKD